MRLRLGKSTSILLAICSLWLYLTAAYGEPRYPSGFIRDGGFVQIHCFDEDKAPVVQQVLRDYFDVIDDSMSSIRQRLYSIYVSRSSMKYGVDPFILASVMIQRSGLSWVLVEGGVYGLMALDWERHKRWITEDHPRVQSRRVLCKPVINVRIGADLMSRNLKRSGMNYDVMIRNEYDDFPGAYEVIWEHYRNMARLFRERIEDDRF